MAQNANRTRNASAEAHIAFMSVPAHGHVNPSLALIAELTQRGHQVSYATTEEFAPVVKAAGARPVVHTSTLPSPRAPQEEWPKDQVAALSMFRDETFAVLPQIEAAYAQDKPDLFVYDIGGTHAPILGAKWDVPCVQVSPTHVYYEGFEEDFGWDTSRPAMREFVARYDELLAAHAPGLSFASLLRPSQSIVTIPRIFQYSSEKVADSYTFVGPLIGDRSHQGDWHRPTGKPILLISMGSTFTSQLSLYRECIAAFAGLDWHVVMCIGTNVDQAELGAIPPNFEVHYWVPQLAVLSHARAFLTHAGMGGTMEGLYREVPMIAVPQAADQFANAARIEELGLGRHIPADEASAEALREALLAVTSDESVATRLACMRREIQESGGVAMAADIVEARLP